jgi:uncharacterized protein YqeY
MLIEQMDTDLKNAMKEKNEAVVSTLRMARSAMKNKQIDVGHPLTEEEAGAVLKSMVKQYKDALNDFTNAGRTDLASKQQTEIELLERYLPPAMPESEIVTIAERIKAETNPTLKDMGKFMGLVMKEVNGRADGNTVRGIVQNMLGNTE